MAYLAGHFFVLYLRHKSGAVLGRIFYGLFVLLALVMSARAQEALRASFAGDAAAESQRQAVANQYYNVKAGALRLRFQAQLGVDVTDNVDLSRANEVADMALRPEVDVTAFMPVSDKNQLTLTMGIGYSKYLKTRRLDTVFFAPNTALSFDIYVGNAVVDLHSRFSYSQVNYQSISEVSQSGNYGYFDNDIGANVTWDFENFILRLGVDYDTYLVTATQNKYQDRSSDLVNASAAYVLNPQSQLGLELGGGLTAYDTKGGFTNKLVGSNIVSVANGIFLSDQKYVNAGPFYHVALTKYMSLKLSSGYTIYFQDSASSFGPASTVNAFYMDLTLSHRVNAQLTYLLDIGRQIRIGLNADTLDYYYAQLTPQLAIFRKVSLQLPFHYEHSAAATTTTGEAYDYYEMGLGVSYSPSSQTSLGANYYRRIKKSNTSATDYVQNQLVLNLTYAF